MDLLELYGRASEWTLTKVDGAADKMDASTPCEGWDVRTLLNHMLETQHYFAGAGRGEDASPPSAAPPEIVSDDPVADFRHARSDLLHVFEQEGVVERTGPLLGIAFADQLLHGHDLARATGQDATMPEGLAESAYQAIHGRFTDEQRKGVFGPELPVAGTASAQDRLLAYTGRDPSR
jgi:uncharacterized protein (TIGR03086 family)